MTEHVHEWEVDWDAQNYWYVRCKIPGCVELMFPDDAEKRLNATERLSAEDARYAIGRIKAHGEWWWNEEEKAMFSLNAYANILEGKDGS